MVAAVPHVVFRGVTKRFGDGPLVLGGIDASVAPGEFVSLIGPSGCGKSTLLRLIAGLTTATGGELLVDGRPPVRGQAGTAFIFQDPTLLPWLNVLRNIEVPLRLRGTPPAERRRVAEELLRLVRLEDARRQYPRELSGGMKMRVSVARALSLRPRLLLMDEPFGALDEMTRQHLNEELLQLRAAQNWTAFFVTHSVAEAVFLSSRVLVMAAKPGRIIADFPVPFPFPRPAQLREQREYHDLVDGVSCALRGTAKAAGA